MGASKSSKQQVRARDKVCLHCGHKGSKKNPLQVHHIVPISKRPDLADNLNNLMLLCKECHTELHKIVGNKAYHL